MRQVKKIYINKTNNPIRESTQTPETKELLLGKVLKLKYNLQNLKDVNLIEPFSLAYISWKCNM